MGNAPRLRQLIIEFSDIEEIYAFDLFQTGTKLLNACHGFGQGFGGCGIRDPERWRQPERLTHHNRNLFLLKKLRSEVRISFNPLAGWSRLANRARAGRINIERAFGCSAGQTVCFVQFGHHHVPALLKHVISSGQEVVAPVESGNRSVLRDRAWVRRRLADHFAHGFDQGFRSGRKTDP